jgi:hypothetical protein
MLKQIKKALSILLVVCFLMSVTAVAASAHGSGWGRWGGYPLMGNSYFYSGYPCMAPYIATVPGLVPAIQETPASMVTYWPAQAVAVSTGPTIVKEKKKVTSKAVNTRPAMVKEKKKVTSKAVSTRSTMVKEKKKAISNAVSACDGGWRDECDCGCKCDCESKSFINTFIDIFIHCLPCNENFTSENFTSENCTF